MPPDIDGPKLPPAPFLPHPIAADVLTALVAPFTTIDDGEARQAQIAMLRPQVHAAIDTIDLAISQNHANYLAGRPSWSYDTRVAIETRLRTLKRQHQHLQEAAGQCNRRLKRLEHERLMQQRGPITEDGAKARLFVQVAKRFLAPETMAMIWEMVDAQQAMADGLRSEDEKHA